MDALDRLAALLDAATPAPWEVEREELSVDFDDEEQDQAYPERLGPFYVEHEASDVARIEADARLAVGLRNAATEFIALARAAETVRSEALLGADGHFRFDEDVQRAMYDALDALDAKLAEVLR